MPTPTETIVNEFYSKFQSKVELPDDLVFQFLKTSIGEFSTELYPLFISEDEQSVLNELTLAEIGILGTLMYKQYLHRERDKTLKLNNIVGKDIKLTAMGTSKQTMNAVYKELLDEIAVKFDKLKVLNFD